MEQWRCSISGRSLWFDNTKEQRNYASHRVFECANIMIIWQTLRINSKNVVGENLNLFFDVITMIGECEAHPIRSHQHSHHQQI